MRLRVPHCKYRGRRGRPEPLQNKTHLPKENKVTTSNLLGQDFSTAVSTHETNCDCVACKVVEKAVKLFDTEELEETLRVNTAHRTCAHDYATGCVVQALVSNEFGAVQLAPTQFRELGFEVLGKALAF